MTKSVVTSSCKSLKSSSNSLSLEICGGQIPMKQSEHLLTIKSMHMSYWKFAMVKIWHFLCMSFFCSPFSYLFDAWKNNKCALFQNTFLLMLFYAKWQTMLNNYFIICLYLALHVEKYIPTLKCLPYRDIPWYKITKGSRSDDDLFVKHYLSLNLMPENINEYLDCPIMWLL